MAALSSVRRAVLVTLGALAVATACGQRRADLRIRNQSDVNLKNVVVFFPDARVEIGDIGAKATSEYRQIPGGVGEYAAFDFSIDGRPISRALRISWVGNRSPGKFSHTRLELSQGGRSRSST